VFIILCLHVVEAQVFVLLKAALILLHCQLRVWVRGSKALQHYKPRIISPDAIYSWQYMHAFLTQECDGGDDG
jgi:hypothetical protein